MTIKKSDVTKEYKDNASPGEGKFTYEEGYHTERHADEIDIARWIIDVLGGDVVMLAEREKEYLKKQSDYLWKNRYWELKSAGSAKSIDSLIRKGIQQIHDNPGGIILDMGKCRDSQSRIESAIAERVRKSCRFSMDVIIIRHGKLEKVIRFER